MGEEPGVPGTRNCTYQCPVLGGKGCVAENTGNQGGWSPQELRCGTQLKDGQRETVRGVLAHMWCYLFEPANYSLSMHEAWTKRVFTFPNFANKEKKDM